jgi:protein gp37
VAENSKIEWTDHTFNPWIGCTKVSPGCDHCYAEGWAKRSGLVSWNGPPRRTSETTWRQPLKWNSEAKRAGVRYRVFCASLADVFDNKAHQQWRRDLFALIRETPNLDWLLLTKRPQNIDDMLPVTAMEGWPWPNVWLGTTAENQAEADRRIPHLLAAPAAKRFLSCEPLLGPIDLCSIDVERGLRANALVRHRDHCFGSPLTPDARIDWVIAGGESGHGARPINPDWASGIRDQCKAAGVPFFFKQWGEWAPHTKAIESEDRSIRTTPRGGANWYSFDRNRIVGVFRVGKKAAGAILDGREHKEFPHG